LYDLLVDEAFLNPSQEDIPIAVAKRAIKIFERIKMYFLV
jgi:hypothetical protein